MIYYYSVPVRKYPVVSIPLVSCGIAESPEKSKRYSRT
jgi:hypothetical protein